MKRGRHGENRQTSTVATAALATCWPISAQGPAPRHASKIAAAEPTTAPPEGRGSRPRTPNARSRSAAGGDPTAVMPTAALLVRAMDFRGLELRLTGGAIV